MHGRDAEEAEDAGDNPGRDGLADEADHRCSEAGDQADGERAEGQVETVGDLDAGIISQHAGEVGGPDGQTANEGRPGRKGEALTRFGVPGPVEQGEGRRHARETD